MRCPSACSQVWCRGQILNFLKISDRSQVKYFIMYNLPSSLFQNAKRTPEAQAVQLPRRKMFRCIHVIMYVYSVISNSYTIQLSRNCSITYIYKSCLKKTCVSDS